MRWLWLTSRASHTTCASMRSATSAGTSPLPPQVPPKHSGLVVSPLSLIDLIHFHFYSSTPLFRLTSITPRQQHTNTHTILLLQQTVFLSLSGFQFSSASSRLCDPRFGEALFFFYCYHAPYRLPHIFLSSSSQGQEPSDQFALPAITFIFYHAPDCDHFPLIWLGGRICP